MNKNQKFVFKKNLNLLIYRTIFNSLPFTDTPTSSLSRKWCKLRQRCASFHAMKTFDCTSTEGPSSLPYQFYDNGMSEMMATPLHPQFQLQHHHHHQQSPHGNNFILAHDARALMDNKPKIYAVIDGSYYTSATAANYPLMYEPIIEHPSSTKVKMCKCKSKHSASTTSLNYDMTTAAAVEQSKSSFMHVLNQQTRLQYFDGEDVKAKTKTRRLSLFGSERKPKKDTTKNFDLKQFKSVSMRCHHHHQHIMYIREQQQMMQQQQQQLQEIEQQQSQSVKNTIKQKFNTVGRKKRSIYDVFFNSNSKNSSSTSTLNESTVRQPTFYVPLPDKMTMNDNSMQQHHQLRANGVNPIRSIRSRSVCAGDTAGSHRMLFHNADNGSQQQMSERKKSNSFNPRESSLEITSFLFSKLKMDRNGDGSEKCAAPKKRSESFDGHRNDDKRVSGL